MVDSLFIHAKNSLLETSVEQKLARVNAMATVWDKRSCGLKNVPVMSVPTPGRPTKPLLVPPRDLPNRKLTNIEGRAALYHSIAHIEFNAINIACDAIYRFQEMPEQFYSDWVKVASEEAYHFSLLQNYLNELGYEYGAFAAHNSLWELTVDTEHDVLVRMALVPRVLEARGLDVSPAIANKLAAIGDDKGVEILEIILRDEIGHVKIGNHWFNYCCYQRNLDPINTFEKLIFQYLKQPIRGPLNEDARVAAGFTNKEMQLLQEMI